MVAVSGREQSYTGPAPSRWTLPTGHAGWLTAPNVRQYIWQGTALNSVGQFDAAGVLQNLVGTSTTGSGFDVPADLPYVPVGQTIQPGESWSFQLWYRDRVGDPPVPGSSANFSDALVVQFS